jgi:cytochrome c oxidase subunit 2
VGRGGTGRRWRFLVVLAPLALLLAACSSGVGPDNGQNPLRPKGEQADTVNNLFIPVFWVAVAVGIFIFVATVYVAIRYRRRPGNMNPPQTHGNTPLEIGWTLIPAVILAVIAVPTVSVIFELDKDPGPQALEVTVVGKQWWWEFIYPKQPGIDQQIVTSTEMHIPTGRDVHVSLKACDESLGTPPNDCNVIHSFWVPELAGKRDVVPGRTNKITITAPKGTEGTYLGQCAEYCGLSHANMRFRVFVQTEDNFADWVSDQQDGPAVTLDEAGDAGELFSQKYQCVNCHTTEKSEVSTYGPNLTHLASRTTFASGYYELTRSKLIEWILDAPSLIPMESADCRLPPPVTCVGMPSFTKNTPPGYPTMSRSEAEEIADYLLSLK